jgi:hypothetical protein
MQPQRPPSSQNTNVARRVLRALRLLLVVVFTVAAISASAHDLERTRVSLTFSPDGAFVLDVANDPDWLKLRIERFAPAGPTGPDLQNLGPVFIDRIVLWVDGREIRPTSAEYIAPPPAVPGDLPNLGIYRMRGRMPIDARTLRWYYGLVIDPYPMTVHRADGRIVIEEIAGDAWSGTIDLSGQFRTWPINTTFASILIVAALLIVPIAFRIAGSRSRSAAL